MLSLFSPCFVQPVCFCTVAFPARCPCAMCTGMAPSRARAGSQVCCSQTAQGCSLQCWTDLHFWELARMCMELKECLQGKLCILHASVVHCWRLKDHYLSIWNYLALIFWKADLPDLQNTCGCLKVFKSEATAVFLETYFSQNPKTLQDPKIFFPCSFLVKSIKLCNLNS